MGKGGSGNYGNNQGYGRGIGGSSGDEVTWQDHLQDRRSISEIINDGRELTELAEHRPNTFDPDELAEQAEKGKI